MFNPFSLASKVLAKVLNFDVVTYDSGAGAVEIDAIFDEDTEIIGDGDIITTEPAIFVHQSSLGAARPQSGQKVTVNGKKWKVEDVMPDGPDAFTLTLKKDRSL